MKRPKKVAKTKNPRGKETSRRVARIAAKVLRVFRDDNVTYFLGSETLVNAEIRALAASALVQRQLPKPRRGRKRK